jgi:hypothetical protein
MYPTSSVLTAYFFCLLFTLLLIAFEHALQSCRCINVLCRRDISTTANTTLCSAIYSATHPHHVALAVYACYLCYHEACMIAVLQCAQQAWLLQQK